MIKGKTPEEIRKLFNIVNDFTPEEEVSFHIYPLSHSHALFQAQIKKENVGIMCLYMPYLSDSLFDRNGLKTDEHLIDKGFAVCAPLQKC